MTDELTEARAQIAVLREALDNIEGQAVCMGMDGDAGNEEFLTRIAQWAKDALAATPSDCYEQIRAEILEEAFAALPEENFKFVDRDKIKAVFKKLKQS